MYHVKSHQHHLQHEGCIYVLKSSAPKATATLIGKETITQFSFHKNASLCLVHLIKPDNVNNMEPTKIVHLFHESLDVFNQPTDLPLSRSIGHTINLILGSSLLNAPSYHLAPREDTQIEHQAGRMLESTHN